MKLPFSTEDHLIISLFIHIILFPHLVFLDLDTFFYTLYSFISLERNNDRGNNTTLNANATLILMDAIEGIHHIVSQTLDGCGNQYAHKHKSMRSFTFYIRKNLVAIYHFLYWSCLQFNCNWLDLSTILKLK